MPCTTTFNPADALLRAGWETICNVQALEAALDKYFLFVNEGMSATIETLQRESIFSNSQRPAGLPSKIVTGGSIAIEVDAEGHAFLMANIQARTTTTIPIAGVYQHVLAPSETTEIPPTFTLEAWRDDNQAQLFVGSRVAELALSVAQRTLLTADVTIQSAYTHYWGDAAIEAGTPTQVPYLRNYPSYATWNLADGDIYVQPTDIAGLPTSFKVSAKVGSASSYGAEETEILNYGVDANNNPYWFDLLDSNGVAGSGEVLGTRDMPVQIFFDTVGTGLLITDEWSFARDRAEWTPVFPSLPPFNEIFMSVSLDGENFCIEQVDVTIARPVVDIFCIGGRFADRTLRRGIADVTGSLQRQYLDLDLRKRLERQEPFKLKIQGYSGEEIDPGWEHSILIVCPWCIASGTTTSVTANDDFPETLDFSSHPNPLDGEGYVDDCTIVLVNSIADLTA